MAIQPATARLMGGSSQTFTCEKPGISWVKPDVGDLVTHGESCVYTAPSQFQIWFSRDVVLTASVDGVTEASAVITLVSAPAWVAALTVLYLTMFVGLVYGVLSIWPPPPTVPWIELSPAIVTVPHGFSQQFDARIWHSRDQSVMWSVTDGLITPNGLFTAPASGKQVVLTVTSGADHNLGQSGLVLLNDHGLYVQPASASLAPSATISFKARTYETEAAPEAGAAAPPVAADRGASDKGGSNGAVKAPAPVPASFEWIASDPSVVLTPDARTSSVSVSAPPQISALKRVVLTLVDKTDRSRQASAVVYLSPSQAPLDEDEARSELVRDKSLLNLVWLMGALGALIGASRSLANFVGNDTFVPRWTLFYVLRPTFGAGLALLVFFGYRIGAITTVKIGASADPFTATFVAGMVGLFADTVLQKLKDVITALFPTQDDRKDKVAAAVRIPVIDSIEAFAKTKKMIIRGKNFASGVTVMLNGKARLATRITGEELSLNLEDSDAGEMKVVVANPDNQASAEFSVKIM
jgi:hypothetical protein